MRRTRILIIGAPKCGKTTRGKQLSESMRIPLTSTDTILANHDWSGVSDKIAELIAEPGPWIIEGCSAVRGLRKYLKAGGTCDFDVLWLDSPYVEQTGTQKAFGASCATIWKECQVLIQEKFWRDMKADQDQYEARDYAKDVMAEYKRKRGEV